jgi:MoxR-like ATPase
MQERRVTLDGKAEGLSPTFMVVATQNPIEQQGVYPLPEAQLDRFLFKHVLAYPSEAEELAIVAAHGARSGQPDPAAMGVAPVVDADTLAAAIAAVRAIQLSEPVAAYVVALVRATRASADISPNWPSPPAPAPLWRGATMSSPTTSRRWPCRPCATASCCPPPPRSRAAQRTSRSRP